jgi:sucrose synthase
MTCGLPTFATLHGGPAEIIEHGVSGFHIDPYHPDQAASILVEFFEKSLKDPDYWKTISKGGLRRIYERLPITDYDQKEKNGCISCRFRVL